MGPVFMCARMDQVRKWALEGDPDALRILLASAPRDVPRSVLVRERDRCVTAAARWLWSHRAVPSTNAVVTLISAALACREMDHILPTTPPFGGLDAAERTQLAAMVDEVLRWSPRSGRRGNGLGRRRLGEICGLAVSRVATANDLVVDFSSTKSETVT